MPGFLVNAGAMVSCLHQGQAQPTMVFPNVKVSGQPIVVQNSVYSITGCMLQQQQPPQPPCATAQWTKVAEHIKAGGAFVLLQDSMAIATPTNTKLNISNTQQKVRGQ